MKDIEFDPLRKQLKHFGKYYYIFSHIHTHHDSEFKYQGPSGYAYYKEDEETGFVPKHGDKYVFENIFKNKIPMFIVGYSEYSKLNPEGKFSEEYWILDSSKKYIKEVTKEFIPSINEHKITNFKIKMLFEK